MRTLVHSRPGYDMRINLVGAVLNPPIACAIRAALSDWQHYF